MKRLSEIPDRAEQTRFLKRELATIWLSDETDGPLEAESTEEHAGKVDAIIGLMGDRGADGKDRASHRPVSRESSYTVLPRL